LFVHALQMLLHDFRDRKWNRSYPLAACPKVPRPMTGKNSLSEDIVLDRAELVYNFPVHSCSKPRLSQEP